ncbi:hypothetical protein ACFRIB_32830 [Streptomyces mirabilis]|uniref:hypothetical protein n=1 Tax=Streptomyces mirabilis TaxID=68239 RepID=UPI0036787E86
MLKEVTATRNITPLREGSSLPGLVEADDLGTYVLQVVHQMALTCADAAINVPDLQR